MKKTEIRKDYMNFTNQDQWKAYLQALILFNKTARHRALLIVYENQTMSEKYTKKSNELNGIGFDRNDTEKMTMYAETIKSGKDLFDDEEEYLKIRLPRYWKQIMVKAKINVEKKKKKMEIENGKQIKMKL